MGNKISSVIKKIRFSPSSQAANKNVKNIVPEAVKQTVSITNPIRTSIVNSEKQTSTPDKQEICSREASNVMRNMFEGSKAIDNKDKEDIQVCEDPELEKLRQNIENANTLKEVFEKFDINTFDSDRRCKKRDDKIVIETYLRKLTVELGKPRNVAFVRYNFININSTLKNNPNCDQEQLKAFNTAYLTKFTDKVVTKAKYITPMLKEDFNILNETLQDNPNCEAEKLKYFNNAYLTKLTEELKSGKPIIRHVLCVDHLKNINEVLKNNQYCEAEKLKDFNEAYLTALTDIILTTAVVGEELPQYDLPEINNIFKDKPEYEEQLKNLNYYYELAQSGNFVKILTKDLKPVSRNSIDTNLTSSTIENLKKIDFKNITITKTNAFATLKDNINGILEKYNDTIDNNTKKTIQLFLTNDIYSIIFKKLPNEVENSQVGKDIRTEIDNYLQFKNVDNEENTYTLGNVKISGLDKESKEVLEHIFKAIPQLVVLLGINQAGHDFDIGKHILAVGQEVVKNEKFKNLTAENQRLVLIAALMHDIAKAEGGQDPNHPQRGADYAYQILKNTFDEEDATTVANLIFNHHFGEYMAKSENNDDKISTLAYECIDKNPEFIKMLGILGEADLLGDNESYKLMTERFRKVIPERIKTLETQIEKTKNILQKLKITLELTPFPQETIDMTDNSATMREMKEQEFVGEFELDNITIPKIDLAKMKKISADKKKEYLNCLGFENVDYNNLEFLIHAIITCESITGIDCLTSQFKPDASLSTSIITMANTKTCNNIGFILEPNKTSVVAAYPCNKKSGYRKGRNISGQYINKTKDMNYSIISSYIQKSRQCTQIQWSELITVDNQVAAIFVKEGCENQMPKELVKFAAERKLPLIVMPQ